MKIVTGKRYTRREISSALGGSEQSYLPTHEHRVVYGAFRTDANPDAPIVILPGLGPRIRQSAEIFASQVETVPVFIKRRTNEWEYVGNYRVSRSSTNPTEIDRHAKRAGRPGDVSMVLFLEDDSNLGKRS